MNPAPIKRLISTSDPDKIDVRVGTILAIEGVAHSEKAPTAAGWPLSGPEEDVEAICVVPCPGRGAKAGARRNSSPRPSATWARCIKFKEWPARPHTAVHFPKVREKCPVLSVGAGKRSTRLEYLGADVWPCAAAGRSPGRDLRTDGG